MLRALALSALAAVTVIGGATVPACAEPPPGPVAIKDTQRVRSTSADPEYVVQFKPGAARSETAAARAKGIGVSRELTLVPGMLARLQSQQVAALRKNPNVVSVERSVPVSTDGVQAPSPWGLDRVDQASLPLNGVYSYQTSGAGVTAYIVDTGVAPHSEFTGRLRKGAYTIMDGWETTDCNGHGTHVAGTVGGTTYGVAKDVTIVPIRVLNCNGEGSTGDTVAALDWIATNHPGGPAVVNLSLGGGYSPALNNSVAALVSRGVTVVVAAGNSAIDACKASPASALSALTVAASDSTDKEATFTNHGSCVDLYAPGVYVQSAWIGSTTNTATQSGTSMATPHVTGAAARLLQTNPSWTPAQVASTLVGTASTGRISNATAGTPNRLLLMPAEPLTLTTATPTIAGTAQVGYTLTANPGAWSPTPVTFTYQWYRVTSAGMAKITGAVYPSYKAQPADRGATLKVYVKGSKVGYAPVTRGSGVTATVAAGTLSVPAMTIGGTAKVGAWVWTNYATSWGPAPVTMRYQWYRVSSTGKYTAIAGATHYRYIPTAADIGYRLRLSVTGSKAGYITRSAWGQFSYTIQPGTISAPRPKVYGLRNVGRTLYASAAWAPAPLNAKFRWFRLSSRGAVAIAGATAPTYRPTRADRGYSIQLRVVAVRAGYTTAIGYSHVTGAIR